MRIDVRSRRRLWFAKAEAKSSFGDDRVFIEKFIVDPVTSNPGARDKHGNVIISASANARSSAASEGDRGSAVAALDETTAARWRTAVALAKAGELRFAGTVEFVAGQTRVLLPRNEHALQVEHPSPN